MPRARRYGRTVRDSSLRSGTLASDDSVTPSFGDRDKVERRASVDHSDARDGHGIQGMKTPAHSLSVVELKGCYGPRDGLCLCVN